MYMNNSAVINIKIEPRLKSQAQKVAEELGLTLSALVKGILKQLIDTKEVVFRVSEKPTEFLLSSLKAAEADVKAGRVVSFRNGREALKYLDDLIADERRRKRQG